MKQESENKIKRENGLDFSGYRRRRYCFVSFVVCVCVSLSLNEKFLGLRIVGIILFL